MKTSTRAEPEERLGSWRRRSAALLAGDDERAAALAEVQRMTTAADWIDRHPREVAAEHAMMMRHSPALLAKALNAAVPDRGDVQALLASIDSCVDVLSGELDIATPPNVGAEIADGVRYGWHRVVTGAAHHVPVEAPEGLADVLADVQ